MHEDNYSEQIINIPIFSITPDENQPRKTFSDDSLNELANSITNNGVIVPIIVKSLPNNKYQIIAGERRWRASIQANKETIPAIVRDVDDFNTKVQALIENVQRDNLNPIEEAKAYEILIEKYNLSHDELGNYIGKSRVTITNIMRLIKLPEDVQNFIKNDKLTIGHAKVLLGLNDSNLISNAAVKIVDEKYSVRETEELVNKYKQLDDYNNKDIDDNINSGLDTRVGTQINRMEKELTRRLSTKVEIKLRKDNSGRLVIYYKDIDDLDRILSEMN